jgi:8-oxo-dGTP pyrophosphatase MutT (NUDIX family)/GNAT superfamily N-acetyltransferase
MSAWDDVRVHREIRLPSADDLARLQQIEEASDTLFTDLVGPDLFGDDPSGATGAADPGFLRVVAEEPGGPAIGFVHVLEADGFAHLEQLSVLPEVGRRGHGRALVRAALEETARRGYRRITLRTYRDVPWNEPFYETCGFTAIGPIDHPFYTRLERTEQEIGLFHHGERVLMAADLDPSLGVSGRPRACAIALRGIPSDHDGHRGRPDDGLQSRDGMQGHDGRPRRSGQDGEVLLMGRIKDSERYAVVPGGGVEPDESACTAALRELSEETGLAATSARYLATIDDEIGRTYYFLADFPDPSAPGVPVVGGPERERASATNVYRPEWVSLGDLAAAPLRPNDAKNVILGAAYVSGR